MREFRVTVKDEVQNNSLLCRVVPSVIDIGGIAGEHNATRITFVLPESWNTDEGSFFVECESNNGEAALSVELSVATENGAKVIYFDIPYGMTAAGTSELTLKQETFDEDGKTLIKCVRSAKLRVRFPDSTSVDGENRKLAEDLLGGMSAEINGLVTRFNNGEFNGKDGAKGEKGDKGDKGEDGTGGIPIVTKLPETAVNGDICLYTVPNLLKNLDSEGRIVISKSEVSEFSASGADVQFYLEFFNGGQSVATFDFDSWNDKTAVFGFAYGNSTNGQIFFADGDFVSAESKINDALVSYEDFPEAYYLPDYDSFEVYTYGELPERYQYSAALMEYDGEWKKPDSLLELTAKSHTHSNKKTLDLFSCQSLDTGISQDASSDDLKWRGKPIAFSGFTATISGVEEIEKDGAKFLRLSLSQGSVIYKKLPDYIDIPVSGVKDVEENPLPDVTLNGSEIMFPTVSEESAEEIPLVTDLPENAKFGDLCLYARANFEIGDSGKTIYINPNWFEQVVTDWFAEEKVPSQVVYYLKGDDGTYFSITLAAIIGDDVNGELTAVGVRVYIVNPIEYSYYLSYRLNNGVLKIDYTFDNRKVDADGNSTYTTELPKMIQIPQGVYTKALIQGTPYFPFFYHEPILMIYKDKWEKLTAEVNTDDIWTAIDEIRGGIDEIESMIDESGVLE